MEKKVNTNDNDDDDDASVLRLHCDCAWYESDVRLCMYSCVAVVTMAYTWGV